jgi:ABC-type multidrug transport system fused ATPase/permease subunit
VDPYTLAALVPAVASLIAGWVQARRSREEVAAEIDQRTAEIEQTKTEATQQTETFAKELAAVEDAEPWVAVARLTAHQHTESAERLSQMSRSTFRQAGNLTVWATVLNTVALVVVLAAVTAALFGLVAAATVSGLASALVFAVGYLANRQADAMNARTDRNQVALETQIFSQQRFSLALSATATIAEVEKRDEVVAQIILASLSSAQDPLGPVAAPALPELPNPGA